MSTDKISAFTNKEKSRPAARTEDPMEEFRPPQNEQQLVNAIRFICPSEGHHFWSDTEQHSSIIQKTITELQSNPAVRHVELLCYPNPPYLEYVINAEPARLDGRSVGQAAVSSFSKDATGPSKNTLLRGFPDTIPDSLGIEIGNLDLSPLGRTPVNTCRLTAQEGIYSGGVSRQGYLPMREMLKSLKKLKEPFIYQSIVGFDQGKPQVTARLATFGPGNNYRGDKGLARITEEGHPYDLARFYEPFGCSSNYQLLDGLIWDTKYDKHPSGREEWNATITYSQANQYTTKSEVEMTAQTLRDIVVGDTEFNYLRSGNPSYHPVYNQKGRPGRIGVTEAQLLLFTEFVPLRYENNLWEDIPGRGLPIFLTSKIVQEAPGGGQSLGARVAETSIETKTTRSVANEGVTDHIELLRAVIRWLKEGGDQAVEFSQDTTSMPDGAVDTTNGRIDTLDLEVASDVCPVESEYSKGKPAKPLTNAHRALVADQMCLMVFNEKSHAETVLENLNYPVNENINTGTERDSSNGLLLYTLSNEVILDDGSKPLLEKDKESKWHLHREMLTLRSEGDVLMKGSAEEDVGTFDWNGLRYYKRDGSHLVVNDDGTVLKKYDEEKELVREWTILRMPFVPGAHTYLDHVIVLYYDEDTETCRRVHPQEDWDTPDSAGKRDRYRSAVTAHSNRYLAEEEGTELLKDEYFEECLEWYTTLSTRKAPNNRELGIAMPDHIEYKGRDGNQTQLLRDHHWVFPPGIRSPHLPDSSDAPSPDDL